ncbi:Clavaminate synthase-like protein [Coniophora puteana RWD-64-598 SS2]|uniref:Clavaminate synthase-like protein n=1 Tax=Coniophora puteana (strain RWD-64-598) TaxID=741705 RepID=A0A5M3MLN5_CONPW|nr:Clavaminate synthase-like protein [Coniophora puteana RWD-64-598 SS2]EIW79585.1 Clavaminate synthase-like protein [Coniophora puteana RWD-64-598 SS2]
MPSLTLPPVPHYQEPPPTQQELPYADLAVIDLAKAGTPDGRAQLAAEVKNALLTHGFFYVINHGLSQAQNERMFDISDVPMSLVGDEEKQAFLNRSHETGKYQGYKPRQYWHLDAGVRDQQEHYTFNQQVNSAKHPEAVIPYLPEIQEFIKYNHFNILHPLLRLIALGLELPEETLVNLHGFDDSEHNASFFRFQKYHPLTEADELKTKNVWLKGHKDHVSVTLLWSQPVAALQILTDDGWRWIRHVENALVVNVGDGLEFLTGGFYKGTIHRVVQPPIDQRGYTRQSVIYFSYANEDVKLVPLMGSPVLQKAELEPRCDPAVAPTTKEWRMGRISSFGAAELRQGKEKNTEEEDVHGIVVKHYN